MLCSSAGRVKPKTIDLYLLLLRSESGKCVSVERHVTTDCCYSEVATITPIDRIVLVQSGHHHLIEN
jgi:PIN domain nuclease of toxin-antitoxin system